MADFGMEVDGISTTLEEIDDLEERWTGGADWVVGTRVEYAVFLEYGTRHMDPKPFMRPVIVEVSMHGPENFVDRHTRTSADDVDSIEEFLRVLALALERRIKEIITRKGLIDTGTLRASIAAVPLANADALPSAEDIDFDEENNAIDYGSVARAQFQVTA